MSFNTLKKYWRRYFLTPPLLLVASAILTAANSWAGDLSTDIRQAASGPDYTDGGYLEIGVGVGALRSPFYGLPEGNTDYSLRGALTLTLNGRYQYRRFFIETFSESMEDLTFGYNFGSGTNWALDIVALQQHEEISEDTSDDLEGLNTRESDFTMGLRATGYFDPFIVQLHGLTDISSVHNGQIISLKLARYWLYKNWNFHAIVGASYRSEKIADYYLSVTKAQASDKFHEFDAGAGTTYVAELGATYPLNERWVLRSFVRRLSLNHELMGSPLVIGRHEDVLLTSINYVF